MSGKQYSPQNPTPKQMSEMLAKVAPQNIVNIIYQFTDNNTNRPYDRQSKGGRTSKYGWDCSEMSAHTMQDLIQNMKKSGVAFQTNLDQVSKAFPIGSNTASQRQNLESMNIPKIQGKDNVKSKLEVGMVIYMTYPKTKSGYTGHVATVSRNPATGAMMISESNGSQGVTHRSVESFFNGKLARQSATKFTLYDPFHKDRPLLREMTKEADRVLQIVQTASQKYTQEMNSPYRKVSGRSQSKQQFIESELREQFQPSNYHKSSSSSKYNYNHDLPVGIKAPDNQPSIIERMKNNTPILDFSKLIQQQNSIEHEPKVNVQTAKLPKGSFSI